MTLSAKRLEMGRSGYGASEVPALVAPSRWSNPSTLYLRRAFPDLEIEVGLPADLGNLLEEPVAKLYQERTGTFLGRVQTLRHPEREIAIATPDRAVFSTTEERGDGRRKLLREDLVKCSRLLQIKTTDERNRDQYGAAGTDAIPEDKLCQVQWEMGTAGVPLCDVGVLFGRREFVIYTVAFDPALFDGLLEIVEAFEREHVAPRIAPPPDAGDAYAAMLKSLYPRALSPVRAATPEEEQIAVRFALWREVEARAGKLKKRESNALRAAMGDAIGLTLGEYGKISFKNNRDTRKIDWQAVAEECHGYATALERTVAVPSLATIIAGHTNTGPGARVLRPTFSGAAAFDKLLPVEVEVPALGSGEEEEESAE